MDGLLEISAEISTQDQLQEECKSFGNGMRLSAGVCQTVQRFSDHIGEGCACRYIKAESTIAISGVDRDYA